MKKDGTRIGTGGMLDVFIGADSTSSSLSNKYRQLVSSGFVFYVVASLPDERSARALRKKRNEDETSERDFVMQI